MTTPTAQRPTFVPAGAYGLHIGGEEQPAKETFDAVDPSVGQIWTEIPQADAEDVDRAVAAAGQAFRSWRRTVLSTRQEAAWL